MDVATTLETEISATENEAAEQTQEESKRPDEEEVIDLLEVADAPQPQTAIDEPEGPETVTQEEEEVIDLLDVTEAPQPEAAQDEWESPETEIREETQTVEEEDEVIDLLEVAEPAQPQADDDTVDDEISDLESRADLLLKDADEPEAFEIPEEAAETAGPDADFSLFETEPAAEEAEASEPFEPVGATLDEPESGSIFVPAAPPETPETENVLPLTEEQIEAALPRVIEKIYGEKIEQLMLQTIEKTVKREIEKIKTALLDDSDGMPG
jgi:hypothetical protein